MTSNIMQIQKAQRKKAKLRLGIAGSSGSGKTWSALLIATGMGGKIGLIDTEAGRAELYGDDFEYDVIRLDAPYSPDRYIQAIRAFENAGYDTLIIDSLSHAWVGEGGVLSIVEKAGGQFQTGWKFGTPKHNALVEAIVTSKLHIITTLRTKTEYVIEENEKGKKAPRKVGMAPVQRDGLEYEFTVFMDINQEHVAHITKDNTKLFDQQFIQPSQDMGVKLMQWLNTGADAPIAPPKTSNAPIASSKQNITSEKFVIERSKIVEMVASAKTLDDLKTAYSRAYTMHAGKTEDMKDITDLKDMRKKQLEEYMKAMAEGCFDDPVPVLAESATLENKDA